MNTEQMAFFKLPMDQREKVFCEKFPEGKLLKEKLLSIGGELFVWYPEEPHLSDLIKEGRVFNTDKIKKVKGEVNGCHSNIARLFLTKDISIATGYALNKDKWIQHSWGFDGKRIVETTCVFAAYYGVILSGVNIAKFIVGQLGNEMVKLPKDQIEKIMPLLEEALTDLKT